MSDIQPPEGRTVAEIRRTPLVVQDDVTFLFDTARFEQLQRLAGVMASCKTMPGHLKGSLSDCFRVASQAMRWQMDPFAICDKTYEVGGKLAYEGQLIAAVVNLRAGLDGRLSYRYSGDPTKPDTLSVIVAAKFRGEAEDRTIEATWKAGFAMSKGARDKWQSQPEQQLSYFGARVWARRHCPEIILGAYTPEELFDDQQIAPPKDITPRTGNKLDALESGLLAPPVSAPSPSRPAPPISRPDAGRSGDDAERLADADGDDAASHPSDEDAFGLKPLPQTRHLTPGEQRVMDAALRRSSRLVDETNSPAGLPSGSTHDKEKGKERLKVLPETAIPTSPAGDTAQKLGRRRGVVADERPDSRGLALGNRGDAANVSDRPQSDLLGGPPAEDLTIPLRGRPALHDLDYWHRQLMALIAEAPGDVARLTRLRMANESGLAALKAGAQPLYDDAMAALHRKPA